MIEELEVPAVHPDITIPAVPATRLTEDYHLRLRKLSRLPLAVFILTIVTVIGGIIVPAWVPIFNVISLSLTGFTFLSVGLLLVFVFRARKAQQAKIQAAVDSTLPLFQNKYNLDVTAELLISLMSGAKLPLRVGDELMRVGIRNVSGHSELITFIELPDTEK